MAKRFPEDSAWKLISFICLLVHRGDLYSATRGNYSEEFCTPSQTMLDVISNWIGLLLDVVPLSAKRHSSDSHAAFPRALDGWDYGPVCAPYGPIRAPCWSIWAPCGS